MTCAPRTSGGHRRVVLVVACTAFPALLAGCASAPAQVPAPPLAGTGSVAPPTAARSFAPAPVVAPAPDVAHGTGRPADGVAGGPDGAPAPPEAAAARDVGGPAAFVPVSVTLPSGRTAPVSPADTAPDGSLVVPADPARVGWWTGGARPGDPYGSVVLAGHVDSRRYGLGAFAELWHARRGDAVGLGAGGSTVRYRVVSVRRVAKARLTADTDAFDQTDRPRLVLITCAGAFDRATHRYADNLVVVAEPVP